MRSSLLAPTLLAALSTLSACKSAPRAADGGVTPDAGGGGGCLNPTASTGLEGVPLQTTLTASGLCSPVDVVRDLYGVPHIYGNSLPDVAYAQGYTMAHDRLIQMDFGRHLASGTLGALIGGASPGILQTDIQMRLHHLRAQAQAEYDDLKASSDPKDTILLQALGRFADGVNAYGQELLAGKYQLPIDYATVYQPASFTPWTPVDSLVIGELLAFQLAFDASDELIGTAMSAEGKAIFDSSSTPALAARAGIGEDLQLFAPVDQTTTVAGWTGFNGDTSSALRDRRPHRRVRLHGKGKGRFSPPPGLLKDDLRALASLLPEDRDHGRGSNNWIIGPRLSASGHVLLANDTHLALDNPSTFYINQLVNHGSDAPLDVMGEQFAGIPLVTLGMNRHAAWAATVSNVDVTDVYQETVAPCGNDGGSCVTFQGQQSPLVPRVESFQLGYIGAVSGTISLTFYDVPEHGPIIPRVQVDAKGNVTGLEPLRAQELSIRYTGYKPGQLVRAIFGLDTAGSMQEAVAALDQGFRYGSQNWLIGDDQGNFGWTETSRVPRRAPPTASQPNLPYHVLPGDGSAEWGPDMDPRYIPHAYSPAKGFLATSNNDPVGVTLQDAPFTGQPQVDGGPLYLGFLYDPGTRVGRSTKRIEAAIDGGQKLTLDDLQSIQADAVSEWGQGFAPTFLDAASALLAEAEALADGGAAGADGGFGGPYPELAPYLEAQASPDGGSDAGASGAVSIALLQEAHDLVGAWSFDTPSGVAADQPTAQQQADSKAQLVMAYWTSHFAHDTLDDELALFDPSQVQLGELQEEKLLFFLCQSPLSSFIKTGLSSSGDSILFDNLGTPNVIESKRMIAAQALVQALQGLSATLGADEAQWAWGAVHTLTLQFFLGAGIATSLTLPAPGDHAHPNGYPRHGDNGTVDVGPRGLAPDDFACEDLGPAIRFVVELDPVKGPTARNALPGGEIFDPQSPHYQDQLALWLKNQTFDYAYADADVVSQAQQVYQKNQLGRLRFIP